MRPALVLAVLWTPFLAAAQVSGLRAVHRDGQTFLTWKEVEPTFAGDEATVAELRRLRKDLEGKVRYRVRRAPRPIAALDGLEPIGECGPLTGWDLDLPGEDPKPDEKARRFVVEEGAAPVPPRTAVFVRNAPAAGEAWYAVTVVSDGTEDRRVAPGTVVGPVRETVGDGPFVLQRVERPKEFQYIAGPALHFFVRWEAPPRSSVPGRPFDYLVAIPPKLARPAPVGIHLHCWGGSLTGGYGWWYDAEEGAILIATNQVPYDWWTGYHERLFTGARPESAADWRAGVVRPFTQTRLLAFLDWVATRWEVDPSRTFVAGSSMGGSGAPMLAIRFPERIAWAVSWVGVHVPADSPQFRSSYENVWGKPEIGVKFEDGTPVWEHFDDAANLRKHPEAEVGFITFSNGKNDGAIGWPQAVAFRRALEETRRPYIFTWGQGGHGERARMPKDGGERINPIDVRTDRSLPAFSRSTLDDDPGDGDPRVGAPAGQANLHLFWETEGAIDEPGRWEMTVGVTAKAPRDGCFVDLTPRRCRRFRPKPGERLRWTDTDLAAGREVASGEAVADALGLVTVPQAAVGKGKNRIRIAAAGDAAR